MLCPICHVENSISASSCTACGTSLTRAVTDAERLPPGATLQHGAYVVDRVLGQGGFGITYLGSDTQLGRAVAIKEFFPAGSYREQHTIQPSGAMATTDFDSARQRFLEEARILARFRHPGIVNVFAAFEENNTAYMVMEFLMGKTLGALVQERGRLEEAEAIGYICETGTALEAVHEAGLLHRDIKPENVMLCHDGRVVLIDFGTARDFSLGRTQGHTVVVTPGYAPLEQYAQRAQRGAFSDVYGLAATLFFLLTGEAPVPATDRAAGVEFVPPHQLVPAVGARVGEAVRWAMEVKVEQRPQSVNEFIQALTAHDRASAEPARPSSPDQSAVVVKPDFSIDNLSRRDSQSLSVQSISSGEAIHDLKWPDMCACCGVAADTVLLVRYESSDHPQNSRIWQVPYCSDCVSHVQEAQLDTTPGTKFFVYFITLISAIILSVAITSITPLALWCIVSLLMYLFTGWKKMLSINGTCCSYGPAVACVDAVNRPNKRIIYAFDFSNPMYRAAFETLNNIYKPLP